MEQKRNYEASVQQANNTRQYEVGGIIFLVNAVYREDGEPIDILLKKLLNREVENARL